MIPAKHTALIPASLLEEVRWNCLVASAGQAGYFSLCGLLLRLRQLYKWEHRLRPWEEPEPPAVLAWIEARERRWEELEGSGWRHLALGTAGIDPFAVEVLNEHLNPLGLAYGAGLSRGLAPTCFLGELQEVRRQQGLTIFILGPELARDLDATPALCQGPLIYARREALAFYLWDRLADPGQQKNFFLKIALDAHGLSRPELLQRPEDYQQEFAALVAEELEAAIRHETGEALEPSLQTAFPALLARFPQTRLELWVRALKDALADVNDWGRLAYLVEARALPSLALLLAWRPGLYPRLLPELEPAFRELISTGDWGAVQRAREQALQRLRETAADLNALLESPQADAAAWLKDEIQRRFLTPLGL